MTKDRRDRSQFPVHQMRHFERVVLNGEKPVQLPPLATCSNGSALASYYEGIWATKSMGTSTVAFDWFCQSDSRVILII
jgi:hypothetical protein